jgi:tol-pal system protein YbgF
VGEVARPRAGVESKVPPLTSVAAPESPVPEETPPVAVTPPVVAEQVAPQPSQGEQDAYIKAVEPLKQRRFEEASVALTDFLARYPDSANADKAHFWLAETHYVNRNIPAALAEFQGVLKDYPKSSKVPGALLKIGYIQDDAKDPKAARITLEEVVRRFPQSGEARLAQSRLDQMRKEGR